jgi:hypothetical protein
VVRVRVDGGARFPITKTPSHLTAP